MTREEYYAGIEAYKNKLEHRAMDANAEDTAGKALENWKNQYLNQAINLRAKQYLASKFGRTDDASTYEKQLQILLDKMTNLKGVSLSAKQAILQTIDQTATNKANVQYAKHSDEPEEGVLEHGGEWKNHKYIRIENGRYIYPEDVKQVSKSSNSASSILNPGKGILQKVGQTIGEKVAGAVLGNSNASGAAINKAQADGAKRTANLQKSAQQKLGNNQEDPKKNSAESVYKTAGLLDKYTRHIADLRKEAADNARKDDDAEKAKVQDAIAKADYARANVEYEQAKGAKKTLEEINRSEKKAEDAAAKVQKSKSNENARAEIEETGSISKETKTESSRQSIESASKAQKEAQAMRAWKNQKAIKEAAKKGEGESYEKAQREGEAQQRYKDKREAAAKAAKLSISAWASGETTDKPGKYANEVNELIKSLDLGGDEDFQKQYISEVVKIYDQERDKLPPNVRSIIDKELANLKDRDKPKKIGHSLNLTREEYYAGIEEYKRKKA